MLRLFNIVLFLYYYYMGCFLVIFLFCFNQKVEATMLGYLDVLWELQQPDKSMEPFHSYKCWSVVHKELFIFMDSSLKKYLDDLAFMFLGP